MDVKVCPTKTDRCVYLLLREDGSPFYVGKGAKNRYSAHLREARAGVKSIKCNIIRRILNSGKTIDLVIVSDNMTDNEASTIEISFIQKYGRIDIGTGILANVTDGGEGTTGYRYTPEVLRKIAATRALPEIKAKHLKGIHDSWARPDVKLNLKLALKAAFDRPEVKVNFRNAAIRRNAIPEIKKKISIASTRTWANPSVRQKRISGIRAAGSRKEVRERRTSGQKRTWEDNPERKMTMARAKAAMWAERRLHSGKDDDMEKRRSSVFVNLSPEETELMNEMTTLTNLPKSTIMKIAFKEYCNSFRNSCETVRVEEVKNV